MNKEYEFSNYVPVKDLEEFLLVNEDGEFLIASGRYAGKRKALKKHYKGRLAIVIRRNNIDMIYSAHHLVANTFLPNPNSCKCIKFKDGDKHNISVSNLEWKRKDELLHKHNKRKRVDEEIVKLLRSEFVKHSRSKGISALAKQYDISCSTVHRIVNNQSYKWIE